MSTLEGVNFKWEKGVSFKWELISPNKPLQRTRPPYGWPLSLAVMQKIDIEPYEWMD